MGREFIMVCPVHYVPVVVDTVLFGLLLVVGMENENNKIIESCARHVLGMLNEKTTNYCCTPIYNYVDRM